MSLDDLADPAKRRDWVTNKHMVVLSLWSPRSPATEVDIFVEHPFILEDAFARAVRADLGGFVALVAAREDLIAMKSQVGRPKDLEDVRLLSLSSTHEGTE